MKTLKLGYTLVGLGFATSARRDENMDLARTDSLIQRGLPWRVRSRFMPSINRAYERGFEVVEARMSGALPSELEG